MDIDIDMDMDIDIDKIIIFSDGKSSIFGWILVTNPSDPSGTAPVLGPAWRQAAPRLHLTFLASAVTRGR